MSWFAENVKHLSLGLLVLHHISLVLLVHSNLMNNGPRFSTHTSFALMEVLKLVISLSVVYMQSGGSRGFFKKLKLEVARKPREVAKLTVAALLCTLPANLMLIAMQYPDYDDTYIDTYNAGYKTKILSIALFSVLLLGKRLSVVKWSSLVLLTVGVALAGMVNPEKFFMHLPMFGFLCIMAAAWSSGFAEVYFEMLLKGSETSLWIQNIQMGLPSVFLAIAGVFVND